MSNDRFPDDDIDDDDDQPDPTMELLRQKTRPELEREFLEVASGLKDGILRVLVRMAIELREI